MTPPLRPIDPGLRDPDRRRRLYLDSAQPSKVTLTVPPGDELDVSDVVADQLTAADGHFKDLDDKNVAAAAKSHVKDAEAAAKAEEDAALEAERLATEAETATQKDRKKKPAATADDDAEKGDEPSAEISGAETQKPAPQRRRR